MKLLFPKRNYNVLSPSSYTHILYLWERLIYFQDRSANSSAGKHVDQSWEYINRSWTHECGNWDWGRAVPRKGIHKWDFPCSVVLSKAVFIFSDTLHKVQFFLLEKSSPQTKLSLIWCSGNYVLGFEKYLVWKIGGKSENQLALQFNSVHSRMTRCIAAASFAMEFAFLLNIAGALYF
jgi:hypothetical protein